MQVKISLRYHARPGEQLVLRMGNRSFAMDPAADGLWEKALDARDCAATYDFAVVADGRVLRSEWRPRPLMLPEGGDLEIRDRWLDSPDDAVFWSSAFRDVIFARPARTEQPPRRGSLSFRVAAADIRPDEALALAGSSAALGAWQVFHPMDDGAFPWWTLHLDPQEGFEYKFVIIDRLTRAPRAWEEGPNRVFSGNPPEGRQLMLADFAPRFPERPWRGAGVAVPVFSLRTEDSFGVGEFHDLKKLVDWAVATGQNVIQLLPVNDTTMSGTWQDSYPYNAISSFALHPQFIHLPDAGVRVDKAYRSLQEELEALPQIDYERVNREKLRLLRAVYADQGKAVLASREYAAFVEENASWLLPYAAFCVLRDAHGSADWTKWPDFPACEPEQLERYIDAHREAVDFYGWLQYLLDVQLRDAVDYAHRHGVLLKGDLPIGVSRTSADAWTAPALFKLDSQAGAPPDAFSADGQNWGFPTYDWDRMAEDGYAWWKQRLRKMSAYFDAFRIDHILGFFRIWEIPIPYKSGLMGHFSPALPYPAEELQALGFALPEPCGADATDVLFVEDPRRKGHYHPRISAQLTPAFARLDEAQKQAFNALYEDFFYHRHNAFWKESAMKKLPPLLASTDMLACGEDLGMIPSCVPETMAELRILSLEIQRMPKDPREHFGHPAAYPYRCVCTTGTHDTSTLRAWWEEDRAETARYYREELHGAGDAPYFCEPWLCETIIAQHLASPAMLCILPLQDWLAIDGDLRYGGDPADERINVPANPRHYWRYRMHCTLESLLAADTLNRRLTELIRSAGRNR